MATTQLFTTTDDAVSADIFLTLSTKRAGAVKGESGAAGHVDAIVVDAWNWGVSSSSAIGSSRASARRAYKNLVIRKQLDRASTSLMSALASNDEVKELKLAMRKAGGEQHDFLTITLNNARITAIDIDCDATGKAVEQVSFSFNKVQVDYEMQASSGQRAAASSFNDEILQA
jgi:type VI secretion system secreted protein Hcp